MIKVKLVAKTPHYDESCWLRGAGSLLIGYNGKDIEYPCSPTVITVGDGLYSRRVFKREYVKTVCGFKICTSLI